MIYVTLGGMNVQEACNFLKFVLQEKTVTNRDTTFIRQRIWNRF